MLLRGDLPATANVTDHAYSSLVTSFFNEMWSVPLPAKVKINLWRIANNFVPTFSTLQNRRLNVINVCPICLSSGKSIAHLMRDCCFVRQLFSAQGDSLTVVKKVCSSISYGSLISPIVYDIRAVAREFDSIGFQFIYRTGNNVVHALARVGRGQQVSSYWIEEAPPEAVAAAMLDLEKLVHLQ
ncbi:hypothetical protein GQ457_08G021920 [Hibiscus cannabinus]